MTVQQRLDEMVSLGLLPDLVGIDTALPQDWVNEMIDRHSFDPRGHFVWDERGGSSPMPITYEGVCIATITDQRVSFPDPRYKERS